MIGSLQDTILGRSFQFEPCRHDVVQVVHIGDNHWALFTTVGCLDGEVHWLDSLHLNPPSRAQKLIADVMQYSGDRILIRIKNVQMQQEFSDCGVLAAAFVTAICYGLDPSDLYFAQDTLHAHLLKCLQSSTSHCFQF